MASSIANADADLSHKSWHAQVERLALAFSETARERDVAGGTPLRERALLRESDLLGLTIPVALGGQGESFGTLLSVVQRFARVDPALAHVFAFHHLMLASLRLFGSEAQQTRAFEETTREHLFWGNALNPKDTRARLTKTSAGYRLDGAKSFCSGARDSDRLLVSALASDSGELLVFTVPTRQAGIDALADWDAFGQRQTDSGTVTFSQVQVEESALLRSPGPLATPRAALRPCLAQAILAHVYLGIAEGAFGEVEADERGQSKVGPRAADPYVQLRAGELALSLEAARLFAARARTEIDAGLSLGSALDEQQRGEVALHVARAKVSATTAGLQIAQGLFELLGPRATTRTLALDRYWRNLRVHTLHDPVDHKLKELGDFALNARIPQPSFYS